jgi:hypothetical protein
VWGRRPPGCGRVGEMRAHQHPLSLCQPGSGAGDHEGLDGWDELCGVVRAGADLAQDRRVLQLRVDPLAGTALAGVRGVDPASVSPTAVDSGRCRVDAGGYTRGPIPGDRRRHAGWAGRVSGSGVGSGPTLSDDRPGMRAASADVDPGSGCGGALPSLGGPGWSTRRVRCRPGGLSGPGWSRRIPAGPPPAI